MFNARNESKLIASQSMALKDPPLGAGNIILDKNYLNDRLTAAYNIESFEPPYISVYSLLQTLMP